MITTIVVTAVALSIAITYIIPEKYSSSTMVLIHPKESLSLIPKNRQILQFPVNSFTPIETASKTYSEMIASPIIAEAVVRRLSLDRPTTITVLGYARYYARTKALIRKFISDALQILKHGRIESEDDYSRAVREVRKALTVQPAKDTYLFEVTAEAKTSVLSAAIANAAATEFVSYLIQRRTADSQEAVLLSQEKLASSFAQVEQDRRALVEFKRKNKIVSLDQETNLELTTLAQLQNELDSIRVQLRGNEAKKVELEQQIAFRDDFAKSATRTTENPLVTELRSVLAKKEVALAGLERRYTREHQGVQTLETEILDIREKLTQVAKTVDSEETSSPDPLRQQLSRELATLLAESRSLEARAYTLEIGIAKRRAAVSRAPEQQARLAELELALALSEETLKLIAKHHEELVAATAPDTPEIRVIHPAVPPLYPDRPIKILYALLAGSLGLVLSIGSALLFEQLDDTIRSERQANEQFQAPLLAVVPRVTGIPVADLARVQLCRNHRFPAERRVHRRVGSRVPIGVYGLGDAPVSFATAMDLSMGGVHFHLTDTAPVSPGDTLELEFRLGDRHRGSNPSMVKGTVVRSVNTRLGGTAALIAVQFLAMDPATSRRLGDFIERERPDSGTAPLPLIDPIHNLRSDLQHLRERQISCVAVGSCNRREGKTTIVANLGVSLALAKRPTVVVDANLRDPRIHHLFGLENDAGLSDVLGDTRRDVAMDLGLVSRFLTPELCVLSSGPHVEDPAALLGSPRMEDVVHWLKERFDYVLFDTPALSDGADAVRVASVADAVVLALRPGATTIEDTIRAREVLGRADAQVAGFVLNEHGRHFWRASADA